MSRGRECAGGGRECHLHEQLVGPPWRVAVGGVRDAVLHEGARAPELVEEGEQVSEPLLQHVGRVGLVESALPVVVARVLLVALALQVLDRDADRPLVECTRREQSVPTESVCRGVSRRWE